jgi:hypothetical protein
MANDSLPASLQESVLAALIFDEKAGAVIAGQVLPKHFDETYREIAERILGYRRKYGRPPGREHLDDLFGKALQEGRTPRLRRVLFSLAELAEGINGDYIISRTQEFVRGQQLKSALIEANSRYEQGGDELVPEVEAIFSKALRFRTQTLDAGIFLNDTTRSLGFLDHAADGISLGIRELDHAGVMLRPKELILYIAPKSSGKTWSCVNVGVEALMQQQKVLHLSLEMPEDRLTGRYYQRLFGGATAPDKFNKTVLEFDKLGRMSGFKTRMASPKMDFSSASAKRELRKKLKPWGTRLGRLVVKHFPSGSLTMQMLEGSLDFLEMQHKFVPTVLIVDYPDLMAQDVKNLRMTLGQTFVQLRGLLSARNMAGYVPTQGSRGTIKAAKVTSSNVSEDISKVFTADSVVTFSQTAAEERLGLGRLLVAHSRYGVSGSTIIITQSYATGQYVLQSALMQQAYFEKLEELSDGGEVE